MQRPELVPIDRHFVHQFSLVVMLFALRSWMACALMAVGMVHYARLSGVFLATMVIWAAIFIAQLSAMRECAAGERHPACGCVDAAIDWRPH